MAPAHLPHHRKLRNASTICGLMDSRQRSLEQLYLRRATLENLIRSLEVYDRTVKVAQSKVVVLA